MMGAVASGRARAAIAGLAEIVAGFAKTGAGPICRIAAVETVRARRDVKSRPVAEPPKGASGSSTTRTRLWVPCGTPDHDNGGEMSVPSQVYSAGISPPAGIAGLANIRGMIVSHVVCGSLSR